MPSQAVIDDFLAQRHVALVGCSRKSDSFTNEVFRHLREGGRVVHPVNPTTDEIDGVRCYRSVLDVPDPLDGVLVMVNAQTATQVVRECVQRGVRRVWLHQGAGPGAVSPEAVALCREAGIAVVDGACPMMFGEHVGWFHRLHRFFVRKRISP